MKNPFLKGVGTRVFALMLLLAVLGLEGVAQIDGQRSAIQVIPQPKQVEQSNESFRLREDTKLILADPRSEEDRFAANDFISDVRETGGLALSVGKRRGSGVILIGTLDQKTIGEALQRAGVSIPLNLNEEGYVL